MKNTAAKKEDTPLSNNSTFNASDMNKAAERYRQAMQDEKSRNQWIENYLPLVKSIVSRLRHHFPENYDSEDMYGIAARALVISVNHFNPSKGKSFGNYATLRIKGALLDELRRIDCLPRSNRAKARSLQASISAFESKYNRSPSVEEIRKDLGLNKIQYEKLLKETQPVTFVPFENTGDGGGGEEEGLSLSETISDPTEQSAFDKAEHKEKVEILRDLIKKLPEQQKKILMLYYYEELKLSEIAQIFSLTEGRISQILSHSLLCLRSNFQTLDSN